MLPSSADPVDVDVFATADVGAEVALSDLGTSLAGDVVSATDVALGADVAGEAESLVHETSTTMHPMASNVPEARRSECSSFREGTGEHWLLERLIAMHPFAR